MQSKQTKQEREGDSAGKIRRTAAALALALGNNEMYHPANSLRHSLFSFKKGSGTMTCQRQRPFICGTTSSSSSSSSRFFSVAEPELLFQKIKNSSSEKDSKSAPSIKLLLMVLLRPKAKRSQMRSSPHNVCLFQWGETAGSDKDTELFTLNMQAHACTIR